MYIVYIGYWKEGMGTDIPTRMQSVKVERAKDIADSMAGSMPECMHIAVVHHRTNEYVYQRKGLRK